MDEQFWESKYQSRDTRFDLGGPTLTLCDWLDAAKPLPGLAVVPGCGRGHDVLELARRGWDALGLDFAPSAIHDSREAAAQAGLSARARFEQRDFFDLEPLPGSPGYSLWWENTCYCAIEPKRRDEYARVAARSIAPGGLLLFSVFPCDGRTGGPPFNIDPGELEPRFAEAFDLLSLGRPPRPSHPARAQAEQLALFERRPA